MLILARTVLISSALLFQPARAAEPALHSLAVRISDGRGAYTQTLQLTEGNQANFTGPVTAANGVTKQIIINALLAHDGDALDLQYQLELSGGQKAEGRSIQVQSEVHIGPGNEITAVKCGPWTVTLALDAKPGAKPRGASWSIPGLPNYRLTANMRAAGSKEQCALIGRSGSQSNVMDGLKQGGKKYGYILNTLFAPAGDGGKFSLQYQTELGFSSVAKTVQTQNEVALTLNKRQAFSGQDYALDFLLEDGAPAKKTAGGKK